MATSMVNGGSTGADISSASVPSSNGKQQLKPTANPTSNKGTDNNRKLPNSPSDSTQKRNATPKAWASGMNPITQRSSTPGHPNGIGIQAHTSNRNPAIHDGPGPANQSRQERFAWSLANSMGCNATITTKNGDKFVGIFYSASVDSEPVSLFLKMVRQIKSTNRGQVNGIKEEAITYEGSGEDHAMTFDTADVIELLVDGIPYGLNEKHQQGFRTDTDISGNLAPRERQLQRWTPTTDFDVDMSLEDSAGSTGETWDQFKANERLFGLKTDYNEEYYTTSIDRSNPAYREREAKAQRLAKEIEEASSADPHIREERGLVQENVDVDEEAKYSGVRRNGADYPPLQSTQSNRYTPPALRALGAKLSSSGAPLDPAIISSQIARPESGSRDPEANSSPVAKSSSALHGSIDKKAVDAIRETVKESTAATAASTTSRPVETVAATTSNTTSSVDTEEVRTAFKNFANTEKSRVAETRKMKAAHDKNIKLNDLKRFSTNFRLHTPVPKDLVPILAKDKSKQQEIVEKAQREAEQKISASPKTLASFGEQPVINKTEKILTSVERQDSNSARQGNHQRGAQANLNSRDKQSHFTAGPFSNSPHGGQGMLSHRLADQHSRHKAGLPGAPAPLPIHTTQKSLNRSSVAPVGTSQPSNTVQTPTSTTSAKFNVKAMEFRPNPSASSFKPPGGPSPSPRSSSNARPLSRAATPGDFFGNKKPLSPGKKPSIMEHFNPLKRLREKAQNENKVKDYAPNGGIAYAHATHVTWSKIENDENFRSYKAMYEDVVDLSRGPTPQHVASSPIHPALLHQLPPHLQQGSQGVPHVQAAQQVYHGPPQVHPYPTAPPHYEEPRMHASPSGNPSYSTPRPQPAYLTYAAPLGQPVQFSHVQTMPPYAMPPGGQQTQNFGRMHAGPPYAHSPTPQFAAPMMTPNASQGAYMAPPTMHAPQMQMFPHGQAPPYGGQSQPGSGYPSPGRAGGTTMMHQSSYQGHSSPMYGNGPAPFGPPVYNSQQAPSGTPFRAYASPQPHYNQSPQQQPPFPPQITRAPSSGYNHYTQGQQHQQMPAHHLPAPGMPLEGSDSMK